MSARRVSRHCCRMWLAAAILFATAQALSAQALTSTSPQSAQPQDGEDVELGQPAHPLRRIGRNMRTVEQRIQRQQISGQTKELQQQILRDLTALIESQSSADSAQSQSQSSSQDRGSASSQTNMDAVGNPSAGELSAPRVGSAEVESMDQDSPDAFLRGVWGQLPDRFWQRLQSAGVDRFLPKYEKLIEEYYKTLAESENDIQ